MEYTYTWKAIQASNGAYFAGYSPTGRGMWVPLLRLAQMYSPEYWNDLPGIVASFSVPCNILTLKVTVLPHQD